MGFNAAGTIQQKYAPILADDKLARKLEVMFSMHAEENRDAKTLANDFGSLLTELAWRRELERLADIYQRAKGKERLLTGRALIEGLGICGRNGYADEPAALLRRNGLPRKIRMEAENVVPNAVEECGKGGRVNGTLALLGHEWLSARVRIGVIETAGGSPYVDNNVLANALAGLLEKEDTPLALRAAAENALETCGVQKRMFELAGRKLEELLEMRAGAEAGERRFIDEAILEMLRIWGRNGCWENLAKLFERKDLTPRIRARAEAALLEAIAVAGKGEKANEMLALLKMELPEDAHIKVIEAVGRSPHADLIKFVDAAGDVLGKRGVAPELKEVAKKALAAPVEECIKRGGLHLGTAALLFKKKGIPWGILNRVMEACGKTDHFTKIAHVFMREDLPQKSAKIAERMLLESIGFFAERALRGDAEAGRRMGLVVHLLWDKRLPESVYLRAIDACCRYPQVHGFSFVEALGGMFSRQDVTQAVRNASEAALVEGGMIRTCAAAGYSDALGKLRRAPGVPDRVKTMVDETVKMMRLRMKLAQGSGKLKAVGKQIPVTPAFSKEFGVDSKFGPPATDKVATDPTKLLETVDEDTNDPENGTGGSATSRRRLSERRSGRFVHGAYEMRSRISHSFARHSRIARRGAMMARRMTSIA